MEPNEIKLRAIGYVRNNQVRDPQKKNWVEIKSEIILNPELTPAMERIEDYSHLVIISWLHQITERGRRRKKISCVKVGGGTRGVFATRAPFRPNPIGITIVKLFSVRGNILEVLGLDVFDGTPILDIKPYTGHPRDLVLDFKSPEILNQPSIHLKKT
ncbi:MAG: tRNA (N6-threonylcarbamoyladenosine(37)-N6)-methyltransferase TrmO [Parcubacteria group bacterium CG11_big_fil_rev_8_21_14_0_20_39_14]|nr:MAG: tRNA (N6-threonylcarbamoyladenosine(37)-N6)-methyltransferase TrmO [Parcubacteria group bacterium CG11_big_fil_rev_8_21_14_0_20_39_14]PIS35204.1 MAG: tRNA (N6-threonylcarbamoyladenosine(37)-N6)-methyltransferase TrmO [Parcubacteria group bacterium CG08_land_8_20_14_0_20_38_56]